MFLSLPFFVLFWLLLIFLYFLPLFSFFFFNHAFCIFHALTSLFFPPFSWLFFFSCLLSFFFTFWCTCVKLQDLTRFCLMLCSVFALLVLSTWCWTLCLGALLLLLSHDLFHYFAYLITLLGSTKIISYGMILHKNITWCGPISWAYEFCTTWWLTIPITFFTLSWFTSLCTFTLNLMGCSQYVPLCTLLCTPASLCMTLNHVSCSLRILFLACSNLFWFTLCMSLYYSPLMCYFYFLLLMSSKPNKWNLQGSILF